MRFIHARVVRPLRLLALVATVSCAAPAARAATPPELLAAKPAEPERVVEARAREIIERGQEVARRLESLEVVSELKLEGPGAADASQGNGAPARWTFDFRSSGTKAGAGAEPGAADRAFARVAIEPLSDGKPLRRITFDGRTARSVRDSDRTCIVGTLDDVGDPSVAMPGWFIDTRLGISPVGAGPDDVGLPPLVAAAVVGQETLDGTACDVVRSVRARMMPGLDLADGTKIPPREMRLVEVVAYARADGLARRASLVVELEGVPSDGLEGVATFTGVRANPPVDDATFATGVPEGYRRVDPPTRMKRGEPGTKVRPGDPAPDFALEDLEGRTVTLASLAGRVALLDFWATWCGPCKASMPDVQRLHDDYAGKPVSVLGVNVGERKADAGRRYFTEKGYSYGCLLAGEALANSYGVSGIPTLVVIGRDGRLVLLETGFSADGERRIREAIEAELAK